MAPPGAEDELVSAWRTGSPRSGAPFETIDCLGVPVAVATHAQVVSWIVDGLRATERSGCLPVFFANAHTLNVAVSDDSARAALRSAAVVLNDGVGLDLYARIHGRRFCTNFNGTDFVPALLADVARRGLPITVFLYGARQGRAAAAARRIEAEHAPVRVVGVLDGFGSDEGAVVSAINGARPDLLLVALGNPLQERWIARNAARLDVRIAMGVGALFDFLSGGVPRAPRILRSLRLEWLFRLALEPRRMFRRYVLGNPLFLWRAVVHRISQRPAPPGSRG